MTTDISSTPSPTTPPGFRPEELPPVTPPSAGFIVQLFLIPALIVMAVVAVWALFGLIADSENDWQQLTAELGSSNEHRRWRAAMGLAQLIQSQQDSEPTEGRVRLAENPLVVNSLTELFHDRLKSTSPTDEDQKQLEFLARTMGALEADDKTLPVLADAMQDHRPQPVRQSALMAAIVIAARGWEPLVPSNTGTIFPTPPESPTITDSAIIEQFKRAAQDPQPVIRHLAAYAWASVSGDEAMQQLNKMLKDGDRFARANAAVGLARNNSVAGLNELESLLGTALEPLDESALSNLTPEEKQLAVTNFPAEQARLIANCLRAIEQLWPQIEEARHATLIVQIQKIEADFPAANVRTLASELARVLSVK